MMPELRPEAVELVDKVKNFIESEVGQKSKYFMSKLTLVKIDGPAILQSLMT